MRAVDPVVATLLVIIIGVVSGIAAYGFTTGLISQTTSQTEQPGSIVIDAAYFDAHASVHAYVRNIGSKTVELTGIMVLDSNSMSLVDFYNFKRFQGHTITIAPGSVSLIDGKSRNAVRGNWYVVKVIAEDGSSASIKVKASW